ncbi:hypothetical protein DIE19_16690 [Burkholderia sp. Bp9126]|nr:hypothetical protein DIE19_16690 [Burkholderia sp. Bp9126]
MRRRGDLVDLTLTSGGGHFIPGTRAAVALTRQFPKWFPGGELNWVKTALRWADDRAAADHDAVVAERADGSVRRVSYRELARRGASHRSQPA